MKAILAPLVLLLPASTALAIDIVDSGATGDQINLGGTYRQNFDSLPSVIPSIGGTRWDNNVTLPGWYSTQSGLFANSTVGSLSSYGNNEDRALGSVATNWSLRFVNTTPQTITGFSVSYDVEQWFRAANSPQVTTYLFLYYRIYNSSISEAVEIGNISGIANWTEVPAASVSAPNLSQTTASALDGNAPENGVQVFSTITGITLAPGQKLWLKWVTGTPPGNPHALATDNVSVSFSTIPEPASAAALLGLASLAFAARRRRHQA